MRASVLLLVLSSTLVSGAGCASAGATPSSTSEPTPGGAAATWEPRLLAGLAPKPEFVRFEIAITETRIAAATRDEFTERLYEAGQRMREGGAARQPGSYTWRIMWGWRVDRQRTECRFRNVDLEVSFTADIVRLGGLVAEDPSAAAWWQAQVDSSFTTHSRTLAFLRDAATSIHDGFMALRAPTCDDLTRRASELGRVNVQDVVARLSAAGRTQYRLADPPRPPTD